MKKYLKYLPKRYHSSINDFYKDEDGWWIVLKSNGKYQFDERRYGSSYTLHEDTLKEALAAFRECIIEKE